jgi:hypothetical protein
MCSSIGHFFAQSLRAFGSPAVNLGIQYVCSDLHRWDIPARGNREQCTVVIPYSVWGGFLRPDVVLPQEGYRKAFCMQTE